MTSLELGRINRVTKLKGIVIFKQNKDAAADPSFPGRSVALRLISATTPDGNGKGKVGKRTYMGSLVNSETTMEETLFYFNIMFEWDIEMMGVPGAFFIENFMQCELFLTSLTLNDVPNNETINFVCNSWIYNAKKYQTERIFFTNQTYLPIEIPAPLKHYIEEELKTLRGDGTGKREEWERIYDYDVYNDLSEPDRDVPLRRPVLGGSSTIGGSCTFPYPRRVRTGREPTKKDKKSESRRGRIYIPRDELLRQDESLKFNQEFNTFEDVLSLFDIKIKHRTDILSKLNKTSLSNELSPTNGESVPKIPKFPTPKVIAEDHYAWMTDEEFAREMIAGVNPNVIEKLLELPRKSKLDSQYGDNTSTITEEHLKPNMNGVTVENAIRDNRLYILDHHDPLYPYLRKINETEAKAYATRTILFLQDDGTLKPLAIELSRPHPQGDSVGPLSNVYLPSTKEPEALIWLLAKAYVVVNDSCYHQLVSHWLKTHCVVEPFIIATNRHLSVVHPIHKLLVPHYRGTMTINARSRNILINAQGIVESTFLLEKYAMEMSAVVYKDWVFTEQGLHNDLIKRGVAVKDGSSPHGLRLLIKDYPYASDGLEIWAAIKSWVGEYVNFYYKSDEDIDDDDELKAFWKELVEVGHGDLKNNATLWVKMKTREELIETCTTLIWIASALHAAVNFGQYQYGGYILNRPTKSIKFMPEKGSPEYDELAKDYMKTYLMTISPKDETLEVMKTMLVLSMHDPNEQYLGQRTEGDLWTSDSEPVNAYKRFAKKLIEIEEELIQRNNDELLKNRYGPVKMPYTLLYPSSGAGLTGRGIPNSVSI